MKHFVTTILVAVVLGFVSGCATQPSAADSEAQVKEDAPDSWKETMQVPEEPFTTTGRNRYFILEPGYQLVFEGQERGQPFQLTITVLDETKPVADVQTRVVEEREIVGGKLLEVSRNYCAFGVKSRHVYYFGEDVDVYEGNKVVHEGAWLAGVKGAKSGVLMPGEIEIGASYYQEKAPEVAMDRAENVSTNETVRTPAGTFQNCLKVKETTPLEPGKVEYKLYAPGIGLIHDGSLRLARYGFRTK